MRYVWVSLGLFTLVAGLAGVKAAQIGSLIKMGETMKKMGPPPEVVSTAVAQVQNWDDTLSAVGSISAAKGVALSNDAPGVVSRINFESGKAVKAGQVLLELDTKVERAQLASLQSRMELAKLNLERTRALNTSGSVAKSQLDSEEAQLKTAIADAQAIEAQISRKIVRAPFTGRLGIRQVNLGQYLNAGSTITVLDSMESVFVDFSMPQQVLLALKVGIPVRMSVQGAENEELTGSITALNPEVDATTRSIKVRASVANTDGKLRPGMFANVKVELPKGDSQVIIPATAVIHASYGDSVFVIQDRKDEKTGAVVKGPDGKPVKEARQQFVRLGEARGDFVGVLDGVKAGDEVVTAGAFKLRNKSGVVINNSVQPPAQLNPRPSNTFGLSEDKAKAKS